MVRPVSAQRYCRGVSAEMHTIGFSESKNFSVLRALWLAPYVSPRVFGCRLWAMKKFNGLRVSLFPAPDNMLSRHLLLSPHICAPGRDRTRRTNIFLHSLARFLELLRP